jgi:hypothetical protein
MTVAQVLAPFEVKARIKPLSATLSPIYNENSTFSITNLIMHWQGGHDLWLSSFSAF